MPWKLLIRDLCNNRVSISKENLCDYEVSARFSQRFFKDKAHLETDQYVVVLDGFVLNSIELKSLYKSTTLADTLISAYERNGELFMNELRGSFNGALYDKENHLWIVFVNHCGDRPLFYHKNREELFVSSDFNDVAGFLKQSGKRYSPNEKAAYYILTYGYMIDDSTHIEGIYRLMPGDYLCIKDGEIEVKPYFRFRNREAEKIGFDEAVEELDLKFRKAVKRVFEKDLEYGYKTHLADMSGGLDSRMVTWVARKIGYGNITNICYAQSQSKEWRGALGVANALGNDFMYMPLDNCNFLYDVDEIINFNYGLAIYAGITGGKRFLSKLNDCVFGLEMTGQLGDVVVGSFVKGKPRHTGPRFCENMYSARLKYEFDKNLLDNYETQEMFAFYTRGFLGALSTHLTRHHYTDVVSPFFDVDFCSFSLKLPLEYRVNHKLYRAWICRKYPDAAKLYTVNYDGPVLEDISWRNAKRRLKKGPEFVLKYLLLKIGIKTKGSPESMNPMDYWYMMDPKVREFIHSYYEENKVRIDPVSHLFADIEDLFYKGSMLEKLLVLTVLAVYKRYNLQVVK